MTTILRNPRAVLRRTDENHPMEYRSTDEMEAGMQHVLAAPHDDGTVQLIVVRPEPGARAVLPRGTLDPALGLVGDCWLARGSSTGVDGAAHPDRQLTLMNARFVALVAGAPDRWPLAGDQLYVDLDLGEANLPAGARLAIGEAVIEISASPHTGCAKFVERFGAAAARLVNVADGRAQRLRGVNAFVVEGGDIVVGDPVRKVDRG